MAAAEGAAAAANKAAVGKVAAEKVAAAEKAAATAEKAAEKAQKAAEKATAEWAVVVEKILWKPQEVPGLQAPRESGGAAPCRRVAAGANVAAFGLP